MGPISGPRPWNPSDFAVAGDTLGSVGSGNIASNFAPTNPDFGAPYFTLPSAIWGGAWASGETFTFQTHPAALPLWLKRVVPAGAASILKSSSVWSDSCSKVGRNLNRGELTSWN